MTAAKDHRVTIRFKPDEYARVLAKVGSTPMSAFVRDAVLEQAVQKRKATAKRVPPDAKAIAQILALLGQNAVVQDFKRAAAFEDAIEDVDLRQDIEAGRALLEDIRRLLTDALNGRSS